MDLLQYLLETYGYNEPIFSIDLRKKLNIKGTTLRQGLKRLIDSLSKFSLTTSYETSSNKSECVIS